MATSQFKELAKDLFKEVAQEKNFLEDLNPNSPFSKGNIEILMGRVQSWKGECDTLFKLHGLNATSEYWGGAFKEFEFGTKGPRHFGLVEGRTQTDIDILYKKGYHLATTIRKLLTGQKNKIRFLFEVEGNPDIRYQEIEMEEEKLFSEELKGIIEITNMSNKNNVNAGYSLKLVGQHQEALKKIIALEGVKETAFNNEVFKYMKNWSNQGTSLSGGRLYEAYYDILEKGYVKNEGANYSAVTNYVRHRFAPDFNWGVQNVGDTIEKEGDFFNQVQLKAFIDGTTIANWGGLPSLITQMNRIEQLLEKIKAKSSANLSQEVLNTFYYDPNISDKMADTLFNQSKQVAKKYIEENL